MLNLWLGNSIRHLTDFLTQFGVCSICNQIDLGWLVDWLIEWLMNPVVDGLIDWLSKWIADEFYQITGEFQCTIWHFHRSRSSKFHDDWFDQLIDWLIDWLIDSVWLIVWLGDLPVLIVWKPSPLSQWWIHTSILRSECDFTTYTVHYCCVNTQANKQIVCI